MPDTNPEMELARAFIRDTGASLFLTGRAGTGKTTFLHGLRRESAKRLVVAAPTGVAAINAGGVTLHSLFQLPFGPIVPDGGSLRAQYRFSRDKKALLRSLDLLIIDEISMVRADILDGVDGVLRRIRRSSLPFGGVQLLLIGDLHQLPPVARTEEWRLLADSYATPYFFSSRALAQLDLQAVVLEKIYRQEDRDFIDILNRVRENRCAAEVLERLNSRVVAGAEAGANESRITLCTHNRAADAINRARLAALAEPEYSFSAEIEGEFPESTYPAAATLTLKKDAQVMFIRNDSSAENRYYNGKIGRVSSITARTVRISCPGEDEEIEVEPLTWENVDYALDRETMEIQERKIGAFRQYPLRLAWAITIHKSQGLTFDQAVIDAQAAFAPGQVYVALSRCRTLEGMQLSAPIPAEAVSVDEAVVRFTREMERRQPTPEQLAQARLDYQRRLLLECFDFGGLRSLLQRFAGLLAGNGELLHVSAGSQAIMRMRDEALAEVTDVGVRFQRQLQALWADSDQGAEDPFIIERLAKASAYFSDRITTVLAPLLDGLTLDSDNKELRRKGRRLLQQLEEEVAVKLAAVRCCAKGFVVENYLRAVSAAAVEQQPKKNDKRQAVYAEEDIAHPELFALLKEWRARRAEEEEVAHYRVLHQKTLVEIAVRLPDSAEALRTIRGIGDRLMARYGSELIELVSDYRRRHDIAEVDLPAGGQARQTTKAGTAKEKGAGKDTREQTLELFRQGLSPEKIASRRELTLPTIEGHLAALIEQGEVAVEALVDEGRKEELLAQVEALRGRGLKEIREELSLPASYAEIRYLLAHLVVSRQG